MAVEVQKLEGEISQPVVSALAQRFGQQVDMGDAALIGDGDLPPSTSGGSAPSPAKGWRNSGVRSWPLRLTSLRSPPTATRRCPSCLTSCSQPPSGGSAEGETIWGWTVRGISACTASGGKAKLVMGTSGTVGGRWPAANPWLASMPLGHYQVADGPDGGRTLYRFQPLIRRPRGTLNVSLAVDVAPVSTAR